MGLYRQVGGWVRDHGYVQTGGGGGGWARDHGSVQTGEGMGKRPWVCTDRWGGDGQETMGLYRQVGGWVRDHGYVQTGGGGGEWARDHESVQTGVGDGQETMGLYRQVGGLGKRPWVCTDRWGDG